MRAHGIHGAKRRGKPWRTTIADSEAHRRTDLGFYAHGPLLYASLMSVYIVSAFDLSGTASEETKHASRVVPTTAVTANVLAWLIDGGHTDAGSRHH
jgi:hypothetical protein